MLKGAPFVNIPEAKLYTTGMLILCFLGSLENGQLKEETVKQISVLNNLFKETKTHISNSET